MLLGGMTGLVANNTATIPVVRRIANVDGVTPPPPSAMRVVGTAVPTAGEPAGYRFKVSYGGSGVLSAIASDYDS